MLRSRCDAVLIAGHEWLFGWARTDARFTRVICDGTRSTSLAILA